MQDDLERLIKYGKDAAKEAKERIIPAIEEYETKVNELQGEYMETVRSAAVEDLGCNSVCVNNCTTG